MKQPCLGWSFKFGFSWLLLITSKHHMRRVKMLKNAQKMDMNVVKRELEASMEIRNLLERENRELKQEVARLKAHITSLKAHDNERKSILWKKIQTSIDGSNGDVSLQKHSFSVNALAEESPTTLAKEKQRKLDNLELLKFPTIPVSSFREVRPTKFQPAPAPPPPPLPSKSLLGSRTVRRVPELVELYRTLTRRENSNEGGRQPTGFPAMGFTKNMIGEIENRSAYLSSIKTDVETRGEFIKLLIKNIENAAYPEISMVESFVKWLDKELSSLVDERAVLKHFPEWPEQKADALREAAFSYRDLKNLESEVLSFEDDTKEACGQVLRKAQALQDRLEQSVNSVERMRESTSRKYREFQIPWEWMTDNGLIGQMKLSSLKLVKVCIKRVCRDIQSRECSPANLLLLGVRFAYRVHQFAGGFDEDTLFLFGQLRKIGIAEEK